jgi:hypothetical protein
MMWMVAVVAVIIMAVGYLILKARPIPERGDSPSNVVVDAGLPQTAAEPPPPPVNQVSTEESDARVRELLPQLTNAPELLVWLRNEKGWLQRFAAVVDNLADQASPPDLQFMAPAGPFEVDEDKGKTTISPKSYARYDGVARIFKSLDVDGSARVWSEMKTLIDPVYAEFAPPGRTFEQAFAKAIQHLLEVPVPEGDVEVISSGAIYKYADPRYEELSKAQKHLLRMGPANMKIIQHQLQQLNTTLKLPAISRRGAEARPGSERSDGPP